VYVVGIKGGRTGWARNALANPHVHVRLAGGAFAGRAREVRGQDESQEARGEYCDSIHWFDYLTWLNWRSGRPTAARIRELLCSWFDRGMPLVIELIDP
jgi:hypothetical protein